MILGELIKSISGNVSIVGNTSRIITGVCYDSRKYKNADKPDEIIFAAINDTDDTAINYLQTALENGCKVVITDEFEHKAFKNISQEIIENTTFIIVENARKAMSEVVLRLHDNPQEKLQFFGITGTNGKTTIAYLLKQMLEQFGIKTALIGTLGVLIDKEFVATGYTTPESPELATILEMAYNQGCKAVVMEVSSHALALYRVWGINYSGAIFSNLTLDHLDFHKTFEEYFNAKAKLFQALKSDSIAVINIDDQYGDKFVDNSQSRIITYGKEIIHKNNFLENREKNVELNGVITNVKLQTSNSKFSLAFYKPSNNAALEEIEKYDFQTSLVGEFNVYNIVAVISLVRALGFSFANISQKVAYLQAVPGRMQTYKTKRDVNVIIDYAHTPDALKNVLKNIEQIKNSNAKIIVVFGCGGNRDKTKRPEMGRIGAELGDIVIITSDNPREEDPAKIIDEIKNGIVGTNIIGKEIITIIDRKAAINKAIEVAQKDDVVVIAGKGHEDYQIIGKQKFHFNDLEQVIEVDNSEKYN